MGSARVFVHNAEARAPDLCVASAMCKRVADLVRPRTGQRFPRGGLLHALGTLLRKGTCLRLEPHRHGSLRAIFIQHALLFLPLVAWCLQGHLAPRPSSRRIRLKLIEWFFCLNQKLTAICKQTPNHWAALAASSLCHLTRTCRNAAILARARCLMAFAFPPLRQSIIYAPGSQGPLIIYAPAERTPSTVWDESVIRHFVQRL